MIVYEQPKKECSLCNEVKPVTDFARNNSTYDKLACWCKECTKKRAKNSEANILKITAPKGTFAFPFSRKRVS